jgi:hypothetical protein
VLGDRGDKLQGVKSSKLRPIEPDAEAGPGSVAHIFSTEKGLRMMYWASRSMSLRSQESTRRPR